MADRGADPGQLAGRDRRADARAADEDAALGVAALDRLADARAPCPGSRRARRRCRCRGRRSRARARASSSSTRSRSFTPRWSNATATLIASYVTANRKREREPWTSTSSGASWDSSCGSTRCARARRRARAIRPRRCRRPTSPRSCSPLTSATTSTSRADPANDRLVFSKGHASPLVYGLFRAAGAISEEEFLHLPRSSARGSRATRRRCCRGSTSPPARSARGCRSASAWRSPASGSTGCRSGSG